MVIMTHPLALQGRTYVIVTVGQYKGYRGYINGTMKRPPGVTKCYVYFSSGSKQRAPRMILLEMSSFREDTQTALPWERTNCHDG